MNFPDKKHFYIFPEKELLKFGLITSEKDKGKGKISITMSKIKNNKYDTKYLFDYENLDETRLTLLFSR